MPVDTLGGALFWSVWTLFCCYSSFVALPHLVHLQHVSTVYIVFLHPPPSLSIFCPPGHLGFHLSLCSTFRLYLPSTLFSPWLSLPSLLFIYKAMYRLIVTNVHSPSPFSLYLLPPRSFRCSPVPVLHLPLLPAFFCLLLCVVDIFIYNLRSLSPITPPFLPRFPPSY